MPWILRFRISAANIGPKRQREANVQHHRQADDFRAVLEALEWVGFGQAETLRGRPARLNRNLSDKTILAVAPGKLAIAAFSPPLDEAGNSVRGLAAVSSVTKALQLDLFNA